MTNLNSHSGIHHNGIKGLYQADPQYLAPKRNQAQFSETDYDLAQWVSDNTSTYYQILDGASDLSSADEAQFMEWWDWAQMSLGGASAGWDLNSSGVELVDENSDPEMGASQFTQSDPFGGQPGTMGNLIHTRGEETVGHTGNALRDYWCDRIVLQGASRSMDVTVERTMDTRWNPAEEVIRVTFNDPATGTESVHYIHIDDPENLPEIVIQTPNESQISDPDDLVGYEEFSDKPENQTPESSVAGIEEDGQMVYEGRVGETIQFNPTADGEEETHVVWGSADITVGNRDRVAVYHDSEMPDPSNEGEMMPATKVVVTHPDGSTDTYLQPQDMDFELNLNAVESRITWGTHEAGSEEGVPEEFAELVTLNASAETENGESVAVDGDAPTSDDGKTFDGSSFDIYSRKDGEERTVLARNDATLHASSNEEFWTVEWYGSRGGFVVKIYENESASLTHPGEPKETIFFDEMVNSLKLDIDPTQVEFLGTLGQDDDSHRVDAEHEHANQISFLNEEESSENPTSWPTDEISDTLERGGRPSIIADKIANAMTSEDWQSVQDELNWIDGYDFGELADPGDRTAPIMNDVIRQLVTAIYRAAGSNMDRFMELLDLIPLEVREQMIEKVLWKGDELNEKRGDDQWTSTGTANVLRQSLES